MKFIDAIYTYIYVCVVVCLFSFCFKDVIAFDISVFFNPNLYTNLKLDLSDSFGENAKGLQDSGFNSWYRGFGAESHLTFGNLLFGLEFSFNNVTGFSKDFENSENQYNNYSIIVKYVQRPIKPIVLNGSYHSSIEELEGFVDIEQTSFDSRDVFIVKNDENVFKPAPSYMTDAINLGFVVKDIYKQFFGLNVAYNFIFGKNIPFLSSSFGIDRVKISFAKVEADITTMYGYDDDDSYIGKILVREVFPFDYPQQVGYYMTPAAKIEFGYKRKVDNLYPFIASDFSYSFKKDIDDTLSQYQIPSVTANGEKMSIISILSFNLKMGLLYVF